MDGFLGFFGGTGVCAPGFILAKQVHYHWSHPSSPFCCGYFGDGGLANFLPGLPLHLHPPNVSLPSRQDYRHEPPAPCSRAVLNELGEILSLARCGVRAYNRRTWEAEAGEL
jgi:hypothetical protein